MASSSLTCPTWNYDVFLSFRGEDSRKTFVDHLYTALDQQGIYTFKDDETLPRGKSIGPSLLKAIEESQIAVVIFSENYADSSWCLDELVYIIKCKEDRAQIVMPIFYHVDPSDVRKQKGKYGVALAKHELENNHNKVECWRKALLDVGSISGWEPKYISNGHEAKCIKEIVTTISHRLRPILSGVEDNLIGMEDRVNDLKSKLETGLGGVLMLGIWGVGGGGKTTLASFVYDEISRDFDGCCFVENIREETSRNGLGKLKAQILSLGVRRAGEGRSTIKTSLRHRKVLIVLDDVDHLDQLEALVGSHDWFGEGSRIIITTRDEHLLNAHRVNLIYNVSLLNDVEATKLFHKHAYRVDYHPLEDYELLVKGVVAYANGLPLALKVLGSFLCDKSLNEWKSALTRLKKIPHNDILGKLKISFDGLQPDEKQLFLDIACFFRNEMKDDAMEILDGCGFHSAIGIRVLTEKALITVIGGRFDMHDLVQEMGHYIVRGEHPNNPEKRSRVWLEKDVRKICAMDATTEFNKIEAIRFFSIKHYPLQDYPPPGPHHHPHVMSKMKKLRFIEWQSLAASSLPPNFPTPELCCLSLLECNQRRLWEGYKYLPNLRVIRLIDLKHLVETPDFVGLPNLERFLLKRSLILKEIHPSIGEIHENIGSFKLLEQKNMNMHSLKDVDLEKKGKKGASYKQSSKNFFVTCWTGGCNNLRGVTEDKDDLVDVGTGGRNNLRGDSEDENGLVDVECCFQEESGLPDNMNKSNRIGLLFFHRALTKLTLVNCNLGDGDIEKSKVWELPSLLELRIGKNNFSQLNFGLWQLPRLKLLNVSSCRSLVRLSKLPSSIAFLTVDYCDSLESVGDISNCKWLWNVSFEGDNRIGPLDGNKILDSMLQGNAIKDHLFSLTITRWDQIPKGLLSTLCRRNPFTFRLPHNWYNEFSGFLICCHHCDNPLVTIIIREEVDKDSDTEFWEELHEAPDPDFSSVLYVGYVSFNLLTRHTTLLNSMYKMISIAVDVKSSFSLGPEARLEVKLVPRKHKGDPEQTIKDATDLSEFYDHDHQRRKTFTIQHHSKSSLMIKWNTFHYYADQ